LWRWATGRGDRKTFSRETAGMGCRERRMSSWTAFKCVDPDGHRIEVYWEA
jgi:hypothetical protein